MFTQHFGELASVDACDAWHLFTLEPIGEAFFGVPMRIVGAIVADDDGFGMNLFAFHKGGDAILFNAEWGYTIVADQRVGEYHHLTCIRGIGQTLRIAHHGWVEDDFTCHRLFVAERFPVESSDVF